MLDMQDILYELESNTLGGVPQLKLLMCFSQSLWQKTAGHNLLSIGGASSTPGTNSPRGRNSPTICYGLIQTAPEQGEAPEHLQCIDAIIMWGNTAEIFEKDNKIVQILLKAGFTTKQSKVKGPEQEIHFLGIKWQNGHCLIPIDVINEITLCLNQLAKKEIQTFLGVFFFFENEIFIITAW